MCAIQHVLVKKIIMAQRAHTLLMQTIIHVHVFFEHMEPKGTNHLERSLILRQESFQADRVVIGG